MSQPIQVEPFRESVPPPTFGEEMKALADTFVEEERDVIWSPTVELIESARDFRARIALPGFRGKNLKVTAAPEALIVEARNTHSHDGTKDGVLLCEFSDKRLFRRLELPAPINVDKVTATLDRRILWVHAPKVAQADQVKDMAAQ